jgi:hypothetical protein
MIKFGAVNRLIQNARRLDPVEAWQLAIDKQVQDVLITLNTQDQMFTRGIDSNEDSLGQYSEVSVSVYGKPRGHIRLYDTGNFYESFRIEVDDTGLTIKVDDTSIYDEPLTEVYGIDILGLTESNLEILIQWILPNYLKYERERLFQ